MARPDHSAALWLSKLWLALAAWCAVVGWSLSAIRQLNAAGYLGAFALTAVCAMVWLVREGRAACLISRLRFLGHRLCRRLRRPLPLLFVLTAALALLGGALYAPVNGDTLIYRVPRLLHWLAREQWHWIHTPDGRLNFYGTATEWMSTPLVVFTHSDRLLFLLSLLSYLQIPGLVFVLIRGLGGSGRTAWHWMWLLGATWSMAMQAGSIANDLFGATFATAALAFALRARQRRSCADWWWSLIAIALMTNVKQSNLALVLPWFFAAAAGWRLPRSRPWGTVAVGCVALVVSCACNTVMNLRHTGNWVGWDEGTVIMPASPWIGLVGNSFTLIIRNLLPPFFPWAPAWDQLMLDFLATPVGAPFRSIELFGQLSRATTEETAGFGLFPLLLVAVSLVAAWWARRNRGLRCAPRSWVARWVFFGAVLAVLVFVVKLASWQNARSFTPYHSMVAALVLVGCGQSWVTRQSWWRVLAVLVMVSTAALLVVSRQRPLWPAQTAVEWAHRLWPENRFVAQVVRSHRFPRDLLIAAQRLEAALPDGERIIGLAAGLPTESELWKPYGSRVIIRIRHADTPELVRAMKIRFVIVSNRPGFDFPDATLEQWLDRWHARILDTVPVRLEPESPPWDYHIVQLAD